MIADGLLSWTKKCVCSWFCICECTNMCVGGCLSACEFSVQMSAGCKQEKHTNIKFLIAFFGVCPPLFTCTRTNWVTSLCDFSLSGVMMRWPILRSRTRGTTTTCMGVRNLQRWPSWCSITPNNRISCAKGTVMSLSSSTHSTARTPRLRGANTPTH